MDGVLETKVNFDCRFYKKKYPEVDELVMCLVKETDDSGAHVELIEYKNKKGFIASSDISRKRTKQVKKIMREGKEEILRVIRVDPIKGYIDLSKKNVIKQEEIVEFEEKFHKAKQVHNIMRTLAQKISVDVEELYKEFCWNLYESFPSAHFALEMALTNPDAVFSKVKISDEHKEPLLEVLKKKMVSQPSKIKGDFKLTCYTKEGIEAIKYALIEGEKISTEDIQIKLRIIGPPLYEISTVTTKTAEGLVLLNKALKVVELAIRSKQGSYLLEKEPKVYGENSCKDIEEQIKKMREEDTQKIASDDENGGDFEEGINENNLDKENIFIESEQIVK
jgi:translation initiation factor 2 subunit 1